MSSHTFWLNKHKPGAKKSNKLKSQYLPQSDLTGHTFCLLLSETEKCAFISVFILLCITLCFSFITFSWSCKCTAQRTEDLMKRSWDYLSHTPRAGEPRLCSRHSCLEKHDYDMHVISESFLKSNISSVWRTDSKNSIKHNVW